MNFQNKWIDPFLEKLESVDSVVFQELLEAMVQFPSLHGGLAQNFGTPAKILAEVIENYKDFSLVPPQVLGNANCPRKLIDHFIDSPVSESPQLAALATNENLSRNDLVRLISRPELASIIAGRSNLPADFFTQIWEKYLVDTRDAAFSLNLSVLKVLACNPKTPLKILRNLAKYELLDSPGLIKSLLMSNPALPTEMMAEFALLESKPVENVLHRTASDWYPTNIVFGLEEFPEHLLVALVNIGHPGGFLRTDVIPPDSNAFDGDAIFDMWIRDQSIYKTLWPELRDTQGTSLSFLRWYRRDAGFTFFDVGEIEFEHEERREDGTLNYHAIPDSPDWLPYEVDFSDALLNYRYCDFEEVAGDGVLEWAEAWNLRNYDPEYISLDEADASALQFMWDQHMDITDYMDEGHFFAARVDENLRRPYGWKCISLQKKSFLIEFITGVYLAGKDGYFQYAEHFLVCICLNPYTEDELIEKYFVDKSVGSELIEQALEVRKSW